MERSGGEGAAARAGPAVKGLRARGGCFSRVGGAGERGEREGGAMPRCLFFLSSLFLSLLLRFRFPATSYRGTSRWRWAASRSRRRKRARARGAAALEVFLFRRRRRRRRATTAAGGARSPRPTAAAATTALSACGSAEPSRLWRTSGGIASCDAGCCCFSSVCLLRKKGVKPEEKGENRIF